MRVVKLKAENVKRIEAVEIDTAGKDVIVISGPNGAGKSSVLDSIWMAIGGKAIEPEMPIRHGQLEAEVELNLGELIVTATWKAEALDSEGNPVGIKRSLVVKDAGGKSVARPQEMLDRLIHSVAFEPSTFLRMKPHEQYTQLLEVAGIAKDYATITESINDAVSQRSLTGRDVKQQKALLERSLPYYPDVKEKADLNQVAEESRRATLLRDEYRGLVTSCAQADQTALELEDQLLELQSKLENAHRQAKIQKDLMECHELHGKDLTQLSDVHRVLYSQAKEQNDKWEANRRREEAMERLSQLEGEYEDLEIKVKDLRADRTRMVSDSKLPVDGLSFSDDAHILMNGVPLAQCAASEQMRVSVAFAMAANPDLKVILVRDASLFDEANLALIESVAKDNGYQLWLEVVDSDDPRAVVIQEGRVV